MPSQQRLGSDEPAGSTGTGERGCDRTEQGPVVVVEFGSVDLAAQDGELMAEDDDLEVLGTAGTNGQTGERGDEVIEDARHS